MTGFETQSTTAEVRPASPLRRLVPPVLAALLVVGLGVGLLRGRSDAQGGPLVGKPAPNFTLQTLDGGTLSLASLKGRPVVLNYWASWCIPCREEAPLLRDLAERQSPGGLAVVGVVYADKVDKARAFRDEYALAFPSLMDVNLKTAINYGVGAVPETFFIDKAGVVRGYDKGGLTNDSLTEGLSSIGVRL